VTDSLNGQITRFLQNVVQAMGLSLNPRVEEGDDGTRINLEGEDGGVLVRRGGEGLQALQHLVATAFRRQLGDDNRIVVDCNGFRRDKDAELKQMARFIADKRATRTARRRWVRSIRTSGASCTWRSPKIRRDVRERWRCLHEDGHHFDKVMMGCG
jgi:predicted RNA-binding protein Jag